jgi:hypothetical protein
MGFFTVRVANKGFDVTIGKLKKAQTPEVYVDPMERYGQMGVDALMAATPVLTGRAAVSWGYDIVRTNGAVKIYWYNTDVEDGVNVALLLQYGHGTGTGGYVTGIDYINPAMAPVFDRILYDVMKEVMQ